jgi:hypothetical protein
MSVMSHSHPWSTSTPTSDIGVVATASAMRANLIAPATHAGRRRGIRGRGRHGRRVRNVFTVRGPGVVQQDDLSHHDHRAKGVCSIA